ncbi:DUF1583 domain-containing protein [Maioricimonas rarisocia]|uniref:DUF1583 domain-containing protein n=1 Tax=Maioricimonas rarisocia TaxID=2528026 RepID=UPI0018D237FC|nr:DUF1583 domain-containing protein [Maioricimonas rarisocia]
MAIVLLSMARPIATWADDPRSDEQARTAIFGDDVLALNVTELRGQTRQLDTEQRYQKLREWVLPSKAHDTIRLTGTFTATNPVPPLVDDHPTDAERLAVAADRQFNRVWTGGNLVSPAYDLIDVAHVLGRLDELRQHVESYDPDEELQIRCRLALLALIDLARDDLDGAVASMDALDRRVIEKRFDSLRGRWPETLLLNRAVEVPQLRILVEPMLMSILTEQVRKGQQSGPIQWDAWVGAAVGRMQYGEQRADIKDRQPFASPPELSNWIPVSRGDSVSRGRGAAPAFWLLTDGEVRNLVSHQDEYLYYRIPLRGNYVLECELTGFDWFDCFPMVGGLWGRPEYTHHWFELGGLDGLQRRVRIDPKLSKADHWIRYRVVVEDGTCTTFLNGRQVDRRRLPPTSSPWIGFYSPHYGLGNVRNVVITGDPVVPEQVQMSADESLDCWIADQLDSVGGSRGEWRYDRTLGESGGIVGRRKDELAGSWQESQLRYHRPMVEDGTIEYEFYYSEAERCHVHPSIGRKAFLLEPDGLAFHWITDGLWDRSELDPLNRLPADDRTPLPLVEGWNRLQLELSGDVVTLRLNGERIDAGTLDVTNDRTFGLFRYADQTEARVRNMTWTGNWPRTVPPAHNQELRDGSVDELDRRRQLLTASFEHEFQKDGFNPQRFATGRTGNGGFPVLIPEGLQLIQPGTNGYRNVWVSPLLQVVGDFDIIAEFDQLELSNADDGDAAAYLITVAEDQHSTHSRVWHGMRQHPNFRLRRISRVEFNQFGDGGTPLEFAGEVADACTSGRMRIVRQGKTMTFLIAEADSDAWRVLHSQEATDAPLSPTGVRLCAGTYSTTAPYGTSRVVWKTLSIRAEQIVDRAQPSFFLQPFFGGN